MLAIVVKWSGVVIFLSICLNWLVDRVFTSLSDYYEAKPHFKFVLGILSARDHFEQRQIIRHTWMLDSKGFDMNNKVLIKFVVTSFDCPVATEYRKDIYSCTLEDKWNLKLVSGYQPPLVHDLPYVPDFAARLYSYNHKLVAVDFNVMHPVVIKSLAIPTGYLLFDHKQIVVELLDLANEKQLVVFASFDLTSSQSPGPNSLLIKPVHPHVLPKGFHGTLIVTCLHNSLDYNCLGVIGLNDEIKHPAVLYSPYLRYGEVHDDLRGLVEPIELVMLPIPAFIVFSMHDADTLRDHIAKQPAASLEWKKRLSNIDSQLTNEMKEFGDIVVVEDVSTMFIPLMDIYRNLPLKLLSFFSWSSKHFTYDFVGKVDDDCFVDLSNILKYLEVSTIMKNNSWHGNFRRNVPVERFGKWADMKYTSSVYPAFACGAGSLISRDVSDWLVWNAPYLCSYQGEDVSMGIWLSARKIAFIQDHRWNCDDSCLPEMFVSAQHNSSTLSHMWSNKQLCGNPCSCE